MINGVLMLKTCLIYVLLTVLNIYLYFPLTLVNRDYRDIECAKWLKKLNYKPKLRTYKQFWIVKETKKLC